MLSSAIAASPIPSRCLTRRAASSRARRPAPSGQRPGHRRSRRTSKAAAAPPRPSGTPCAAWSSGGSSRVARVAYLGQRVVVGERRRRDVVGPAPEHELLVAELLARLRLVLALQGAVVPLVQPPGPAYRQPAAARRPPARCWRSEMARVSTEVCTTEGRSPASRQHPAGGRSLLHPPPRPVSRNRPDIHPLTGEQGPWPVPRISRSRVFPWRASSTASLLYPCQIATVSTPQ
jgi:hypothetical protein